MTPIARLLVACLLAAWVAGCSPSPSPPPRAESAWPDFDGEQALSDAAELVSFGSRAVGTPGHRHAQAYLQARLRAAGLEPRVDTFVHSARQAAVMLSNIEAVFPGTERSIILVTTHYDSWPGGPVDFQAANGAASGPAVLLELARVLQAAPRATGPEIRLVWFDGQEPLQHHTLADGLQGSRHYARQLVAAGIHRRVIAAINLDMVGDRDLAFTVPRNVDPGLRQRLIEAARAENARHAVTLFSAEIGDDHEPFLERGIPAINLIDFHYGSAPGRNDYWRSEHDTIDKISAESLGLTGRVTLRLLRDMVPARKKGE